MAAMMIGFAVTQARADRISYNADRCFGTGCVTGAVGIGQLALSLTDASIEVYDSEASATALANFSFDLGSTFSVPLTDASVKSPEAAAEVSTTSQNSVSQNASPTMFSIAGLTLSLKRTPLPADTNLALAVGHSVRSAAKSSFSVAGVDMNGKSVIYQANNALAGSGDSGTSGKPGGPPTANPEPTTLLLLGTGLAATAAVARRRLKGRSATAK